MNKGDLCNYINSNLKRGLKIEEIKQQLLSRGFSDYDINEAIGESDFDEKSEEKNITPEPVKEESIEDWDMEG